MGDNVDLKKAERVLCSIKDEHPRRLLLVGRERERERLGNTSMPDKQTKNLVESGVWLISVCLGSSATTLDSSESGQSEDLAYESSPSHSTSSSPFVSSPSTSSSSSSL